MLLPALAPAVRAGLRLLLAERAAGRALLRTSFRAELPLRSSGELFLPAGLPWPLCWPMAEVLPLCRLEAPLPEWLCALPFPFDELAAAWRWPFELRVPFELQRVLDDEREVRAEEFCAGLRSREWAAGRLKCGRVADCFCETTGLRTAGYRGA